MYTEHKSCSSFEVILPSGATRDRGLQIVYAGSDSPQEQIAFEIQYITGGC